MTMDHIERSFAVTLHINHPTIDPEVISRELGLTPQFSAKVGQPRVFPSGTPREGAYLGSGWSLPFDLSGVSDLSEFLHALIGSLKPQASFFANLVREGGRIEFFCGIFADGNWDECFTHEILRKFADLSIDLRLDVWPAKRVKETEPN